MKILTVISLIVVLACNNADTKVNYPSPVYHTVAVDTAKLAVKGAVYVPIYSHIYTQEGNQIINLSATLSIRNTSYTEPFYVTDVVYYGSQGEVLKHYLTQAILIKPMASAEFFVEHSETKGGAGANFVVKWGTANESTKPLIQAVMNATGAGISFTTDGVAMQ